MTQGACDDLVVSQCQITLGGPKWRGDRELELMAFIVGRAAVPAIDAWASASTLTDE
jgi:hypothetical protein